MAAPVMVARAQGGVMLVFFLLAGALIGSLLSEALAHSLWIFARSADAGLRPSTLNLLFFNVTFGFQVRLTLGTVIGLLGGLYAFRRL
jgi:hypothetical protein